MKLRKLLAGGFAALSLSMLGAGALADKNHDHDDKYKNSSQKKAVGLVKEVIRNTRMYRDDALAMSDGWTDTANCVSSPDEGAMGVHYVNFPLLLEDGTLDVARPEALIYEVKGRKRRLVGVEYIVIAKNWHEENGDATPVLMGQLFHLIPEPNRYGLPAVYGLHVWAFRENPHGTYTHWNPNVTCDYYDPENY